MLILITISNYPGNWNWEFNGQDGYEINFSVTDLKDMTVAASCREHQESFQLSELLGMAYHSK